MVRFKNRYFLCEIVFEESISNVDLNRDNLKHVIFFIQININNIKQLINSIKKFLMKIYILILRLYTILYNKILENQAMQKLIYHFKVNYYFNY